MAADLFGSFLLPLAVLVSAAATTSTAAVAWTLYQSLTVHERALFGDDEVDGHDGIVTAVNMNTRRSESNRRVLRVNEMAPRNGYEEAGHDPPPEPDSISRSK